jgi:hypothetical protein
LGSRELSMSANLSARDCSSDFDWSFITPILCSFKYDVNWCKELEILACDAIIYPRIRIYLAT